MEFGEKLQNLRKASNLSQEQLADMLGVSRQSVSKWESGVTYPEMDKLIAMAKLFKCSMDDLVNNEVKDKEIVTTKNKENEKYVDSLLNFVVDTVNMFLSMKFTTLIKSLFEIFIIGFILFGGALGLIGIIYSFIDSLSLDFGDHTLLRILIILIFFAIVLGICLFAIISFFQIFKIRYLDYYRKAVYKEAQVRDLKLEINKQEIALNNDKGKIEFKKMKEPMVIMRDPRGTNLKFLEVLSEIVRNIIDIFLIIVSLLVLVPISIVLIVGLVICIYLISVNSIFVGCVLTILGAITICWILYELLFDYVTSKKVASTRLAIMFVVSLVIASVGVGFSLIKLKDIKFVENQEQLAHYSQTFEFNDDLVIMAAIDDNINFIVDDTLKDVKIDVEYSKMGMSVCLDGKGSTKYVHIKHHNDSTYNELNLIIEGLKNNKFYSDYDYASITVYANKNHIKSLINNLTDKNLTYVITTNDGYRVEIEDVKSAKDLCNYDKDGIKRCYHLYANQDCKVGFDNTGKINSSNKKCTCNLYRNEYHCY